MRVGRGVAILALLSLGCSEDAEPRGQWLVVVDTNLASVSQALADERVSFDATVDTLRVDVIRDDGSLEMLRELLVVDERDWPVSFGVVLAGGGSALLRIRAFSSGFSSGGEALGQSVLEPAPSTAVDRLVELPAPGDSLRRAHVLLDGDCIGLPPSFSPRATCIDVQRPAADPRDGWFGDTSGAALGSWPASTEAPCVGSAPEGSVCIPGGFSVMGSMDGSGVADGTVVFDESVPPRPVVVSPFHLDVTEVTVGRLRKLANDQPASLPGLPRLKGTGSEVNCTWLGANDPSNDDRPVNCVLPAVAEAVCVALGGRLPSEAEWEHAARGRGQRRRYPWGDAAPTCCTLVAGGEECGWEQLAPVGESTKHDCADTDRSRDGVLDLAGSVAELTRDVYASFDEPCWAVPGVRHDPVCTGDAKRPFTMRGGNSTFMPSLALATLRRPFSRGGELTSAGFRCVYPQGGTR